MKQTKQQRIEDLESEVAYLKSQALRYVDRLYDAGAATILEQMDVAGRRQVIPPGWTKVPFGQSLKEWCGPAIAEGHDVWLPPKGKPIR